LSNLVLAIGAMRENSLGADAGWFVENSGIAVTAAALRHMMGPNTDSILPDEVK
jgi:hypothetical protein